jgi:hypothetical protein
MNGHYLQIISQCNNHTIMASRPSAFQIYNLLMVVLSRSQLRLMVNKAPMSVFEGDGERGDALAAPRCTREEDDEKVRLHHE